MDCDLLDVMTLEGERSTHVHGCTQFVQLSSCLISHDRFLLSISPKPCVRGVTKHNSDQVRNSELVGNTKSHMSYNKNRSNFFRYATASVPRFGFH